MDLHIQKVADRMDEQRGAGQSSKILTQGLDPCEGGRSILIRLKEVPPKNSHNAG